MKETMPAIETTSAGAGALIKIFGVPVLAGAAASALLFLFMWPKTLREAFVRFACAIVSSFTAGPLLALAAWLKWPEMFREAMVAANAVGADPLIGVFVVAAPFLLLAALPAWWIMGAAVLWFERRRGKDIGELVQDAGGLIKGVKEDLL